MPRLIENNLFFTIQEVATELGANDGKIRTYVRQGRLKTIRIGKVQLISEEAVRELQKKRDFTKLKK